MNFTTIPQAHEALCAHMYKLPYVENTSTYYAGDEIDDDLHVACIVVVDEDLAQAYFDLNVWCTKNNLYYLVTVDDEDDVLSALSVTLMSEPDPCVIRKCRCVEGSHSALACYPEYVSGDDVLDFSEIPKNIHENEAYMQHLCIEAVSRAGDAYYHGDSASPATLGSILESEDGIEEEDLVHYPDVNICLPHPSCGFNNTAIFNYVLENIDWSRVRH